MSEQPQIRISTDPNKPGAARMQEKLDKLVSENLDTLNTMQAEAGLLPIADPRES
ncbi:hypothetical protein [Nocardia sp. Marseille-Q1738]